LIHLFNKIIKEKRKNINMVLLNIDILVNKNSMIHSIKNIMNQVMHAYYDSEMLVDKIEEKKK
jgi:hypothetical protein